MLRTKTPKPGDKVRVGGTKLRLNDQLLPACKRCGGVNLKRVRGRLGMVAAGALAPKTVARCETCGKRY
jgi:hypothetical protein